MKYRIKLKTITSRLFMKLKLIYNKILFCQRWHFSEIATRIIKKSFKAIMFGHKHLLEIIIDDDNKDIWWYNNDKTRFIDFIVYTLGNTWKKNLHNLRKYPLRPWPFPLYISSHILLSFKKISRFLKNKFLENSKSTPPPLGGCIR